MMTGLREVVRWAHATAMVRDIPSMGGLRAWQKLLLA